MYWCNVLRNLNLVQIIKSKSNFSFEETPKLFRLALINSNAVIRQETSKTSIRKGRNDGTVYCGILEEVKKI